MCKNFINKKKPENGLNLRVLSLSLRFLLVSVRPHAGVIDFFVIVAPLFICGVPFFAVRPVIIPAKFSRLLAVVPCPFPALYCTFFFVP